MALIIQVKVVPSSGKTGFVVDKAGVLKCYLKSPPEKGQANKELIRALAKAFRITQTDIEILTGLTCRIKRLKINLDLSEQQMLDHLGLSTDKQLKLF